MAEEEDKTSAGVANDGRSLEPVAGRDGWAIFGAKVIRRAFDDQTVEELYLKYVQRSRESDLDCFFLTGCLVAVHTAVSLSLKQQQDDESRILVCAGVSSVVAVAQASLGFYIRSRKTSSDGDDEELGQQATAVTGRLTYASWLLANMLILGLQAAVPSQNALAWLLLVNFLTCVTLPLRLRVCLLLTSAASLIFLIASAFTSWDQQLQSTVYQQVVLYV